MRYACLEDYTRGLFQGSCDKNNSKLVHMFFYKDFCYGTKILKRMLLLIVPILINIMMNIDDSSLNFNLS